MEEYFSSKAMFNRFINNFSGEADEPFILQVTNSSPNTLSFYLSQGLLYTRGAETNGQLRTGAFPAISGDPGSSLTASTMNSISIEQFIAYMQDNPTKLWRIEATTSNPTPEYGAVSYNYRQGMIKNEAPILTPMRAYADKNAYNLQFFQTGKPRFISAQDIVTMPVAGNSTLTLNIYPEVTKNDRVELSNDVNAVKKTLGGIGEAAQQMITAPSSPSSFSFQSAIRNPQSEIKKLSPTGKVLLAAAAVLAAWWVLRKIL